MSTELLLQGNAMWSFEQEIKQVSTPVKLLSGLSGLGGPIHHHKGQIALTEDALFLESNQVQELIPIALHLLDELYLGYDEVYTAASVKNFGLFWQPLRITYTDIDYRMQRLYLIIDYKVFSTNNKQWYEQLRFMLQ